MDSGDKRVSLNQLVNNSDALNKEQLFSNNSEQIFVDNKTEKVIVNDMNGVYNSNKPVNNNQILNTSNAISSVIPTNQNSNVQVNAQINSNVSNQSINNIQGINSNLNGNINNNQTLNTSVINGVIPTSQNNNIEVNYDKKDKDKFKNKFSIKGILTDRKFLLWMTILIFVFTSITVGKTFYLRSVVDNYEEFFTVIEEKESLETVVYDDEEILDDSLKNIAASELISCINSSIDINNLPSSITSIIDEINAYYNQSNNYFAFKYKDIYTGFSISYNEKQKIFTASTIKAPKDIYIYEMASQGKIDLDEKLTYTSGYYNTGSGTLKNKSFNTKYDVRTLSRYSIVYSDNAAHNMLMDKYGRKNMLNFWKEKGTNAIFTEHGNWGVVNAYDAVIYMEELYRFYLENDVYGQELMNNFFNANPKFIKGKNGYKIANKSGWSGTAIHDVSIVFADNPYIVVALSNLGRTDYYMSYFNKANDFAYRLHTEYWKYKMDTCDDISQY